MAKAWKEMTPEEKRAVRLEQWLNPAEVKFRSQKAEKTYKDRVTRITRALLLQEPDRVPVSLPSGNFPAYYSGGNLKKVMYDYKALRSSWTTFIRDFNDYMDTYQGPGLIHSGSVLEILKYKFYKWPGHGLGDNVNSYQFIEGEYMLPNEYDALIKDPSDFAMRVLLPRVVGSLEAVKKLPPFSTLLGMPMRLAGPFGNKDVREAFQSLINAGKEMEKWQKEIAIFSRDALSAGFPTMRGSMAVAPFDTIGDSLRGTQGVIMDMYRQPEKLLEAIEMVTPIAIDSAIDGVNASQGFMCSFPLHKGDDTFMSDKQFEKFYWPSLRKVILALIQEGIMIMLFAEGKYLKRLRMVNDLPKGWVMWQFDQTDMAEAKRILGPTTCIAGNVPTSVMCTGTAAEVKNYCRKLIEICAPGGGYILMGGASATETCPENLKAMMEAAKEYGTY
jgi:Uroporphyrinogen decarboxylase (URO-D)